MIKQNRGRRRVKSFRFGGLLGGGVSLVTPLSHSSTPWIITFTTLYFCFLLPYTLFSKSYLSILKKKNHIYPKRIMEIIVTVPFFFCVWQICLYSLVIRGKKLRKVAIHEWLCKCKDIFEGLEKVIQQKVVNVGTGL